MAWVVLGFHFPLDEGKEVNWDLQAEVGMALLLLEEAFPWAQVAFEVESIAPWIERVVLKWKDKEIGLLADKSQTSLIS